MDNNRSFLGTEPIGRLMLRLSVPTIIAQLINMLYNIVDRIYIGHIPGEGALALTGVGVCLPILMIVAAFANLTAAGGAPRASIAMGKGENGNAEAILGGCACLQAIIAIVITVILQIWAKPMLLVFGASENTIPYALDYMLIYSLGTVFVQLTLGLNAFITAQGYTRISMLTVLIGAVTNIILDPVFIFVLNMGVRGAALATIISQFLSAVWCIAFLSGKKSFLRLRTENLRIVPTVVFPCVALGTASFIMLSSESIITVLFNASLLKYGGDTAVGAMTICATALQFITLPMNGLGQGAQPITGYNFGAGNAERVKKSFRTLLTASLCFSSAMWLIVMLFPGLIAGIFTDDAALFAYTGSALRIFCGASLLFGIQMACQNTFLATGNTVCSIIVAVVRKFVLLLPFIYLMPALFTADRAMAVLAAEPAADVIAITFTSILFAVQFKKIIKKMNAAA